MHACQLEGHRTETLSAALAFKMNWGENYMKVILNEGTNWGLTVGGKFRENFLGINLKLNDWELKNIN